MIEMETSVEVLCIRIMTHPQVFGQKFTPIRRFLGLENSPILAAHPYYDPKWKCPPGREMGKDGDQGESSKSQRTTRVSSPSAEASLQSSLYPEMCMICKKKNLKLKIIDSCN